MNPAENASLRVKKSPATRGLFSSRFPVPRLAAVVLGTLAAALSSHGQTYNFSTLAGIGGTVGYVNGSGGGIAFPLFNSPSGVVVNKDGNLYVCDLNNNLIRLVTPAGAVTTFAGTVGRSVVADGTGLGASFNGNLGPAVDGAGNLYVADFKSNVIRKITPAGVVTTVAGVAGTAGSTDGASTAALFSFPSGVAVDSSGGTIYVADTANHTIRKITSAGVTTFAGAAGIPGGTDGTGTAARFDYPRSIALDSAGNLFVADAKNNAIRKITSAGVVTTFAGTAGTFGSTDAVGTAARFSFPNSVSLDSTGNLYVADELNNAIRKIATDGTVTTLAGQPGSSGMVDATGSNARFNDPNGVAVDGSGNVYVADHNNQLIRKVSPAGAVTTVAGVLGVAGALDGLGYNITPAQFRNPTGIVYDPNQKVTYVADTANGLIRKVTTDGVVTSLAGNVLSTTSVDGNGTNAVFNAPSAVGVDSQGNVFVADTGSHIIRKVTPSGDVTTIAGTIRSAGFADAIGTAAKFNSPTGIAVGPGDMVYVADYANHVIRRIDTSGTVTTFAGTAGSEGSADGQGTAARFSFPRQVAVDSAGNVYVADTGNNTIRKISSGGTVVTLAGSAGAAGSADGIGSSARFSAPAGITVDGSSNVYVSDSSNSTIRMITVGGVVTTIGGAAGVNSNVDGAGAAARFDHPTGITVDGSGNLYIADTRNQTIRMGSTSAPTSPTPGSPGSTGGTGGGTGPSGLPGNGGISGSGATNTGTGFLLRPVGIVNNPLGGIYVADSGNNSIKTMVSDTTGVRVVTVLAGKDGTAGSADGTGSSASFNNPTGIVSDSSGNLYVCDTGNATIRKITSAGVVTTLAGSASTRGNQDGTGAAASFSSPTGIVMNSATDLFVTDSTNNTIRKVTLAGVVTTFAGTAKTVGDADGLGAAAKFNNPTGIAIDGTGYLYIADTNNHTIRKVPTVDIAADTTAGTAAIPAGTVTTYAGSAGISGAFDGGKDYALFNLPTGISVDSNVNVYIADTGNSCIRLVQTNGVVVTIAGFAGVSGFRDGTLLSSLFNQPRGIVVSSTLLVADTGNSVLRSVSNSVSTVNLKTSTTTTPGTGGTGGSTGGSSGGGGATEPWLVAALALLATAKFRQRTAKV